MSNNLQVNTTINYKGQPHRVLSITPGAFYVDWTAELMNLHTFETINISDLDDL